MIKTDATCPCKSTKRVLCSVCIQRTLGPAQERHRQARAAWEEARRNASTTHPPQGESSQLAELQEKSYRLRERIDHLKQLTSTAAIEVCAAAVANERRQDWAPQQAAVLHGAHQRLQSLQRANHCCLEDAIKTSQRHVRILRQQWALAAFRIHKLSVDEGVAESNGTKQARGISKIGGLPLPNAGAELFGVLPAVELQSALRMVASLTSLVAKCLGILLPHPIILRVSPLHDDIADYGTPHEDNTQVDSTSSSKISDSMTSLAQRAKRSVFPTSRGRFFVPPLSGNLASHPPSMDPVKVQQRLKYSQVALLAEGDEQTSSRYALEAVLTGDEFAIAWQLLQNNVIALCIKAGVPVAELWPAQAILLNLNALLCCCERDTLEGDSGSSSDV